MDTRHLYEVHLDDGSVHDVRTPHHHDDHDDETFARHLLDVIKGAAGGVIGGLILRIIHKGHK